MARWPLTFAISAGLILSGCPAIASDWTIKGSLSQTSEVNDNYFMVRDSAGRTFRMLSNLNLESHYRTAVTSQVLTGNISYYNYSGPGSQDTQLKHGIDNFVNYGFKRFYKLPQDQDFFNASWSRSDVASQQLADVGTVTSGGDQNTYTLDTGFVRQITPRDTLTMLVRGSAYAFTNEEQNYTDLLGSVRYSHAISSLTELTANVDFDYLKYNNPQNTETEFWKFLGGFITKFTSQFTVRGNLGIALVNTKADTLPVTTGANNLPPPLPPPLPGDPFVVNPNAPPPLNPVQGAGSAIDWIGDIFLTYRDKTTTYSLFASRYISPNTTGELQQRQTVGAAIRHEINSRSGLTLASSYGLTSSGGENATKSGSLSATAAYDFSWTREFRGQLAYTYRRNFTGEQQTTTTSIVPFVPVDNSPITSHGVYVVFTKDFTIKP